MAKRLHTFLLSVLLMEGGAALEEVKAQSTSGSWSTALSTGSSELSDAENSGNDLTRPLNSIELRLRYLSSASPGSTTEKEYAFLRATTKFDLDGSWKVSLYGETEGVDKQTSSFKSGSSQDAGLYDSMFQAVLIHSFSDEWAVGAGARAVAPTASDNLGSGKWQIMPGFGVRYTFLDLGPDDFFVPAMRYAVSVAGTSSTRDISELQIAPTLNLDLPGPWFLALYPSYDIRINYGPPVSGQTGKLFLPADAELGYKLSDEIVLGLEVSVPIIKDYPVYDFKTQLRVIVKY